MLENGGAGQMSHRAWRLRAVVWTCLVGTGLMVGGAGHARAEDVVMSLTLSSSAFQDGRPILSVHTCDGRDSSPPLSWSGTPQGTKSVALISDDPDAPGKTWVHWVLYNVPSTVTRLPEGLPPDRELADGSRQGMTDFGRVGYGGPCPPSGTHRYFFKLYALDTVLSLAPGATKAQLEAAMKGHVVTQAQLMGTYQRKGR
jgi:Raf kinase inhibitor-like YbhB/YbcL family protein